jgi:hypothetical protein
MKSRSAKPRQSVTRSELIAFLRRLAAMYDNPRTGNVALAEALHGLVDSLIEQSHSSELPLGERREGSSDGYYADKFRNLDLDSVGRVLSDKSATKRELVELAAARFSIPRARLMKISTDDVREAIRTALLHEKSISIIAEEARRSGADRKS